MSNVAEEYNALSETIQNKESEVGFEGLSENDKQSYLVDCLLMEVNNGGFDQYFTNTSGQHWNGIYGFPLMV